jgi:hypothetical protein
MDVRVHWRRPQEVEVMWLSLAREFQIRTTSLLSLSLSFVFCVPYCSLVVVYMQSRKKVGEKMRVLVVGEGKTRE